MLTLVAEEEGGRVGAVVDLGEVEGQVGACGVRRGCVELEVVREGEGAFGGRWRESVFVLRRKGVACRGAQLDAPHEPVEEAEEGGGGGVEGHDRTQALPSAQAQGRAVEEERVPRPVGHVLENARGEAGRGPALDTPRQVALAPNPNHKRVLEIGKEQAEIVKGLIA